MINVALLDQNEPDREAWKKRLQELSGINLLFATDSLESFHSHSREKIPDIVLLELPEQGHRVLKSVRELQPNTDILILTENDHLNTVHNCLRNGAVSYLHKGSAQRFLSMAIEITHQGGSFISPDICRDLVRQRFTIHQHLDSLTARELQMAEGLMDGLSYKMIADRHEISLDTVRVYVKRIYKKLKVHSKGELLKTLSA